MARYRDGFDWEFYVDERSDRIRDFVPEDEVPGGRERIKQRAQAIAQREARALGFQQPGIERTTEPQPGRKVEEG